MLDDYYANHKTYVFVQPVTKICRNTLSSQNGSKYSMNKYFR